MPSISSTAGTRASRDRPTPVPSAAAVGVVAVRVSVGGCVVVAVLFRGGLDHAQAEAAARHALAVLGDEDGLAALQERTDAARRRHLVRRRLVLRLVADEQALE